MKINLVDFSIDEIESIELMGEMDVMDIRVADTHMFFANDIYTHNCSATLERITIENVAESYAKVAECDLVIGISRGNTSEKDQWGQPITLKQLNLANVGFLKNRFGLDGHYKRFILNTSSVFMELEKKDHVVSLNNLAKNNLQNNSPKITDRDSKESINEILEKTLGNLG